MLREEVTEAEVVDMDGVAISEAAVILEDTMAEDIMADTSMEVAPAFFLEPIGDPASIFGDGPTIPLIIGDGPITIPTMGDGHIPILLILPIPTIPILLLQLLRQNPNNRSLIIGIFVRTRRVIIPTLKSVREVG
jgi:hypothetical protein